MNGIIWFLIIIFTPLIIGACKLLKQYSSKQRELLLLIKMAVSAGMPVEKAILEVSGREKHEVDLRLARIASRIKEGMNFIDAIAKEGSFMPRNVINTLRVARASGMLKEFLPLCSALLGKKNYNFPQENLMLLRIEDFFWIALFAIFLAPRIKRSMWYMLPEYDFFWWDAIMQMAAYSAVVVCTIVGLYLWVKWLAKLGILKNLMAWIDYYLPWKHYSIKKDFIETLSVLLGSGIGEDKALLLAAEASGNTVIAGQAVRAVKMLQEGSDFVTVIGKVFNWDRDFAWRSGNLMHSPQAFMLSVQRYCISLDIKTFNAINLCSSAFITTAALIKGLVIGLIAISVFDVIRIMILTAGE